MTVAEPHRKNLFHMGVEKKEKRNWIQTAWIRSFVAKLFTWILPSFPGNSIPTAQLSEVVFRHCQVQSYSTSNEEFNALQRGMLKKIDFLHTSSNHTAHLYAMENFRHVFFCSCNKSWEHLKIISSSCPPNYDIFALINRLVTIVLQSSSYNKFTLKADLHSTKIQVLRPNILLPYEICFGRSLLHFKSERTLRPNFDLPHG